MQDQRGDGCYGCYGSAGYPRGGVSSVNGTTSALKLNKDVTKTIEIGKSINIIIFVFFCWLVGVYLGASGVYIGLSIVGMGARYGGY